MPEKPRKNLLRHADQAQAGFDRALYHLAHLKRAYAPNHPDYETAVDTVVEMTMQIKDFLETFRRKFM